MEDILEIRGREQARTAAAEEEERRFYEGIARTVCRFVARELVKGKTEDGLAALVDDVLAYTDQQTEATVSAAPPPLPRACKAGCSWCCYLRVEVTAPEVFRIADFLRQRFPAEAFEALKARVAALDGRTRGLDRDARSELGVPCPLLVEDRCSVYPVRPLKCRGGNSTDEAACRRFYERGENGTLPVYAPQFFVADAVQAGLEMGMVDAGLTGERLELIAALRIALEEPDAALRWQAGEPVFRPARQAP